MHSLSSPRLTRTLPLVLGAPALFGAVLGLRAGLAPLAARAGSFPAVWLLVAALMAPALYIGTSLLGLPAAATRTPGALLHGLRASALVLLGVTPATAFLLTTVTRDVATSVVLLGGAAALAAAGAGLLAVFAELFPGRATTRGGAFFVVWSVVSVTLGTVLFVNHVV